MNEGHKPTERAEGGAFLGRKGGTCTDRGGGGGGKEEISFSSWGGPQKKLKEKAPIALEKKGKTKRIFVYW